MEEVLVLAFCPHQELITEGIVDLNVHSLVQLLKDFIVRRTAVQRRAC